jgi:hypothetical protein
LNPHHIFIIYHSIPLKLEPREICGADAQQLRADIGKDEELGRPFEAGFHIGKIGVGDIQNWSATSEFRTHEVHIFYVWQFRGLPSFPGKFGSRSLARFSKLMSGSEKTDWCCFFHPDSPNQSNLL